MTDKLAPPRTLRDEVLYILGRSTAPLNGSEIYERATLADEMKQVSNAIFQLTESRKISRIVGDGRARYVLAKGTATPAPAGKAGRPAADPGLSLDGAAGGAQRAPDRVPKAQVLPIPPAPLTGIRPSVEPDLPKLDIPTLGDSGSAAPFGLPIPDAETDDTVMLRGIDVDASAARLADAMIANSREQLAPGMEGGPLWWIDQDGCLEISDRGDNGILIEFTREEARRMAEMIVATHDVLEQLA